MTGLLEATLLAAALFAVGAWLAVVAWGPRPAPSSVGPRTRARRARLWLYAPLWIPLVLVAAALAPGLLGSLLGVGDHCLAHGGHHHHFCLMHPPHPAHSSLRPFAWLLAAAVFVPALALTAREARRFVRGLGVVRSLVRSSRPSRFGDDVTVLDRREPIAITVGLFAPSILVSEGLLRGLPTKSLRVVLAHERAHVRRRDALWAMLDRFAAALLPAFAREDLEGDLSLAREQQCDAEAARAEGGALLVAGALTEVARLGLPQPSVGLSAGASCLEARVRYLLDSPAEPPRRRLWPLGIAALTAIGAGPGHTLIEWVVTGLLH